jgi:hypothetical protein
MKDQNKPVKKPSLDERIEAFVQLAKAAEETFTQACIALFEMRQEYPHEELYPKILKRVPFSEHFLDRMCEAAQRRFPAALLLYPSAGATYLQTLPYEKAEQHSKQDLPVVVHNERSFETEYKRFHQLTNREVRQVFDGGRVRPAKEQMSWLKRRRLLRAVSATAPEPFDIVDGCVLFNRDTKMTADEIEVLLRRLRRAQHT